ncbi:MAG: hypothetical protein Tsb009_39650 [Planctomycetaceae bacterium]
MITVHCRKCGVSWDEPDFIDDSAFEEFAEHIRAGNALIPEIKSLREKTDIDLETAKAIRQHMTTRKGKCHQCDAELLGSLRSECPACGSMNYDW